ncbi:hypothetical protein TNCV_2191771 [Trichonephila clavipes]|nr:hypothetical protein TNCV_2191771 [Trichonephila clavipes]
MGIPASAVRGKDGKVLKTRKALEVRRLLTPLKTLKRVPRWYDADTWLHLVLDTVFVSEAHVYMVSLDTILTWDADVKLYRVLGNPPCLGC